MTAFKTGKVTEDGREVLFLPTSPNITTGFVIEVESSRITELDEDVEDARRLGDTAREAQADAERAFLVRELARAGLREGDAVLVSPRNSVGNSRSVEA